jgi:NAD(P) transhydrogenase
VELVRGHGRFVDANTIMVEGPRREKRLLRGDYVVIATGSCPNHPADVEFDDETVVDSATILQIPRMPRSLTVLGAGVIGVEYASIFAALGITVTLVDTRSELLPYLDREVAAVLQAELSRLGIIFIAGATYRRIDKMAGDPPRVRCELDNGRAVESDVLLYSVGRNGSTTDIGLENAGLRATPRGLLEVDAEYRTTVPHIFAVGDVIGYPALASTSMEQGRQAVRNAFGLRGPRAHTEMLPFAIYSIPEVSYIGATEESLRERGIDYVVGRGRYDHNPRGQILGATGGILKLIFAAETLQLLGVHIVGYSASELVHIGQAFLHADADAWRIAETLYNYPTLSDLYRHAALEALPK